VQKLTSPAKKWIGSISQNEWSPNGVLFCLNVVYFVPQAQVHLTSSVTNQFEQLRIIIIIKSIYIAQSR